MFQLNLPSYQFRIKKKEDYYTIFDAVRRKYVILTPEEWVRQHFILYLINQLNYPIELIAVEKQLEVNGLKKRCDAIVYDKSLQPILIVELKAPTVPITQDVFDQVAVYNSKLKVNYFLISNGMEHFCCKLSNNAKGYEFLDEIIEYQALFKSDEHKHK